MTNIIENNTIVGYTDGMAIIKMDDGRLGYYVMPEEFAYIGEVLPDYEFTDIKLLPGELADRIRNQFGG